jgi:hypothetical protein
MDLGSSIKHMDQEAEGCFYARGHHNVCDGHPLPPPCQWKLRCPLTSSKSICSDRQNGVLCVSIVMSVYSSCCSTATLPGRSLNFDVSLRRCACCMQVEQTPLDIDAN